MSIQGWIKLHRSIMELEFYRADEPFDRRSAWVDLLLLANWKDQKPQLGNAEIEVPRGSLLTSISALSKRWKWSRGKVIRFLDVLELAKMADFTPDIRRTHIRILNYEQYPDVGKVIHNGADTKRTHDGHHLKKERSTSTSSTNVPDVEVLRASARESAPLEDEEGKYKEHYAYARKCGYIT